MVVVGGYLALKLLRLRSDPTGFDHWSNGTGQKGLTSGQKVFRGGGGGRLPRAQAAAAQVQPDRL